MPNFQFEGREEKTGKPVGGVREAASHADLGRALMREGVLLTRYEQKKTTSRRSLWLAPVLRRVPVIERALFARYFALMLRAGLDVKRAMGALAEQARNKNLKKALKAVETDVEKGKTVSEAMEDFPYAFPSLFVGFVKIGEKTGKLQEALEVLAEQLQKEYELKRAVRGGLMYPAVIVAAVVAVAVAMMIFVVPRLAEVFEGFDVQLPLATRVLIGLSDFLQAWWPLVIIGVLAGAAGVWMLLRIERVNSWVMHGFLYVPVLGSIMQKVNLARFSRNLSSLLASGVDYIEALDLLARNTPHPSYAKVLVQAREHVKQGGEMSGYLEGYPRLYPHLVISIIKIGEETGSLDKVLSETAVFYEGEVDQTMKNMTSIMEPVLMILVGLAVGALAVSVISPIYDLVNVI